MEGASERAYLQGLIEHRYDDVIVPVFWGGKGKSSLRNLVEEVRRRSRTEDCGKSVWIVCDTDQNQVHKPMVEAWLKDDPDLHHTAVSDPCLEYWLALHYQRASIPTDAAAARTELTKFLPAYKKGGELPKTLFDATQVAVDRERRRQSSADSKDPWEASGSSQLLMLIEWMDGVKDDVVSSVI